MANALEYRPIVFELSSSKIRFGFGGEEKPMKISHKNIVKNGNVMNWNEMEKARIGYLIFT